MNTQKINQIIKKEFTYLRPSFRQDFYLWLIEPYKIYPNLLAFKAAVVQYVLEQIQTNNYDEAREVVNELVQRGQIGCLYVRYEHGVTTTQPMNLKSQMHKDHWAPQSPRNKARSKRLKNT